MAIIRFGKWHKPTKPHYTANRDFKNMVIYTYGFGKWHKQNIYTYGFGKWHKTSNKGQAMNILKKSKTRVVKKFTKREPVTIRCGARVSTITFPKDPKKKGEVSYRTDYSVPTLKETNSIMADQPNKKETK